MVIIGTCVQLEDVKRLYLPGIVLRDDCPLCHQSRELDLSDNYPWGGQKNGVHNVTFSCPDCEEGWTKQVRLKISVEAI